MQNEPHTLTYRLDAGDVIRHVGPGWEDFGRANGWGEDSCPEHVIGRPLWAFISDISTRQLYHDVFRRVRDGISPVGPIPFRCDSPCMRRFLELRITGMPDGAMAIESRLLRSERRPTVRLLDSDIQRTARMVRMCSMCKKVEVGREQWLEVEEGLAVASPFEDDMPPSVTHGICPVCYEGVLSQLDES